jgi:DNA modification methylase
LENKEKYKRFYLSSIGGNNKERVHPCIKPSFIIKNQIEISSKPGSIILDLFIGSGTTARATKDLKRDFIGIEINPVFVEIAKEHIAQGIL